MHDELRRSPSGDGSYNSNLITRRLVAQSVFDTEHMYMYNAAWN